MKGTTKKNFGKSGRSGAVLAFAGLFIMAMALAFTACEAEKADPIASEFQSSDYSGWRTGDYTLVGVTVGADSITVGINTLTGVSTNGGDSESETLLGVTFSNSWAYVWHDGDKVGIVCASSMGSSTSKALGLGPDGATSVANILASSEAEGVDVSDVVTAGSDFDGYYTYP